MLKKLRIKIVAFTMAIVVAMLCVIFGTVYHFTAQSLEDESLRLMQELSSAPMNSGRPGDRDRELNLPYFVLQIGPQGEVLGTRGGYYDLSDTEFVSGVLAAALEEGKSEGVLEEYSLRFCVSSSPMGASVVFVDTTSERAALTSLVKTSVFIGLASLLVFFGISLLLAHIAVKPVEKAWEQQRRFVADASHELKTPLTVIMTNAELLQNGSYTPAEQTRISDGILAMSRQMRGLVEGLLELARVDNGRATVDFEDLELSRLVDDCLLVFEPVLFEKGLSLKSDVAPGLSVHGSRRQLEQVLDILLDNAMKYSFPGGEVSVSLRRRGNHCLLAVADPGEPMSGEELRDIFKRFYRADRVRSMNGSYGLGLPIAQGIVSAHRGKIWAESAGGYNTFFVLLPAI